jgi:hypothetical protein
MEFGLVSVVLDEHLEGVRGSQYVRKTLRPGHISVNRTHRLQDSFTPVEYVSDEDSSSSSSSIVSNRPSTPDNDSDVQFAESLKGKLPTQSKLPPKGFLSRLSAKKKKKFPAQSPQMLNVKLVLLLQPMDTRRKQVSMMQPERSCKLKKLQKIWQN